MIPDKILKYRSIALAAKVHMVFLNRKTIKSVARESWIIKESEAGAPMSLDCEVEQDWRKYPGLQEEHIIQGKLVLKSDKFLEALIMRRKFKYGFMM